MTRLPGRLRAIFDCNTLIQAMAFDGPAAACVRLVESGQVELFMSRQTLAELRRVLAYEEVAAMSPNMTPQRVGAFVQRLEYRAVFRRRVRHAMDYPRDPADEPYIDLAIAARADYLVTRDKDLLDLMAGHSSTCKQFRRKAPWLRVTNPVDFLEAFQRQRLSGGQK